MGRKIKKNNHDHVRDWYFRAYNEESIPNKKDFLSALELEIKEDAEKLRIKRDLYDFLMALRFGKKKTAHEKKDILNAQTGRFLFSVLDELESRMSYMIELFRMLKGRGDE